MQSLPLWLDKILAKTTLLGTLDGLAQIFVIVIGALAAWQAQRDWRAKQEVKEHSTPSSGLVRVALTGVSGLVLPLVLLLFIGIGWGVLRGFKFETHILDLVIPLLLAMAAVRLAIYILKTVIGPSQSLKAWEKSIAVTAWSVAALYLMGWLPAVLRAFDAVAIDIGEVHISVLLVLKLGLSIGSLVLAALWAGRGIERKLERLPNLDATLKVAFTKVSKFALATLAILIGLRAAGVDLTAFAVLGGAFGVGLGFGLQRIAANLVSGFILLFDRSIRPGDVISVGDDMGTVAKLHARYIVVKKRDGSETLIPNESVISSPVTNWSYTDRSIRIKIPVQISYLNDPEFAMSLLIEAARSSGRVLKTPEPVAELTNFGESGMNLELSLWLNDPEEGIASVKSTVNLQIWRLFKQHGITIPFPQREVRLLE